MTTQPIEEGTILWEPPEDRNARANITRYLRWLDSEKSLSFKDCNSLWEWSVTEIEAFWSSF